jgi:hypothetical protein
VPTQDGQPQGPGELLEKCWSLVDSGLLGQATKIFQEVQVTLTRSSEDAAQRLARELSLRVGAVAQAYRLAVRAGFEAELRSFLEPHKIQGAATMGAGLALMAIEESDITGQVNQAAARLRDLVRNAWTDLSFRLQTLSGRAGVAESELPLRPALFVQAAAEGLGLGPEAPGPLVRTLAPALAGALGETYGAIDRLLAARGVEPRPVVRVAPVLRPSAPATIRRELPATLEASLLEVHAAAAGAPPRRGASARAEAAVPRQEISADQPDAWGLHEYVRLQALLGVNASALVDAAMERLQDGNAPAGGAEPPARDLAAAMLAAQKLDAAHIARVERAGAAKAAQEAPEAAAAGPGQDQEASEPAPARSHEPRGTREYSQRLIGLADSPLHKHAVQLSARIFARIERDRIVPATIRTLIVGLRFPFMEAVLADPVVLVRPAHPARSLVNAIASASVEWRADTPEGRRLMQQARTAVQYVLGSPGTALAAFSQAQAQFAGFLAERARAAAEGEVGRALEALRAAEEREMRAVEVGAFLQDLLGGAPLDARLRQFLLHDWPRVLVEASQEETVPPGTLQRMLAVVPDLVWSVQPIVGAQDRRRFAEAVPALLESLRAGVASIGWSGSQLHELVEHLREAHARALAAGESGPVPGGEGFSVSTVRIRLDGFRMQDLAGPPRLKPFAVVEEAVHHFLQAWGAGVMHRRVQTDKEPAPEPAQSVPAEQLLEQWQPGTWFDLRVGRAAVRMRLEGFTPSRSLALFSSAPGAELYSLSHASLLVYVRNAWMRPVERLPLVARAFRTLLSDLRRSAQAAAEGGDHAA